MKTKTIISTIVLLAVLSPLATFANTRTVEQVLNGTFVTGAAAAHKYELNNENIIVVEIGNYHNIRPIAQTIITCDWLTEFYPKAELKAEKKCRVIIGEDYAFTMQVEPIEYKTKATDINVHNATFMRADDGEGTTNWHYNRIAESMTGYAIAHSAPHFRSIDQTTIYGHDRALCNLYPRAKCVITKKQGYDIYIGLDENMRSVKHWSRQCTGEENMPCVMP